MLISDNSRVRKNYFLSSLSYISSKFELHVWPVWPVFHLWLICAAATVDEIHHFKLSFVHVWTVLFQLSCRYISAESKLYLTQFEHISAIFQLLSFVSYLSALHFTQARLYFSYVRAIILLSPETLKPDFMSLYDRMNYSMTSVALQKCCITVKVKYSISKW